MQEKPWWKPIVHFGTHTIVGTMIFLIIATPAIGLSLLVKYLSAISVPKFTLDVLTFLEHTIVIADAVMFVVYLGFTSINAFKEMK